MGLLGAVVAVGAVLVWADLSRAQPASQSIASILEAKAQRTPAQRKLSSQLLDATGSAQPSEGVARRQAPGAGVKDKQAPTTDVEDAVVTVDIRADVTPAVLARIQDLGGTVLSSVPKYRAIRAQLPFSALEPLATLEAVQSIRPADQPITHQVLERSAVAQAMVAVSNNTPLREGDVAHQANVARSTHGVDGTGISVGVLSDGVDALAAQQATGEVPAGVTVLPGQAGGAISLSCNRRSKGTEGTAMLEIVHDLAPGAELFFATGINGAAQMAQNIEDLCAAGANVIVDDIGYLLAPAFQDGVIAQAVSSVVADGCYYFSAAGNGGNLNDSTSGVWEGDFVAGPELILNGVPTGAVYHDFDLDPDNDVTRNAIVKDSFLPIVLQWTDPWGKSANDYDLFLIDADNNVLASSTNTQDGNQDPIEFISGSCANDRVGTRLVIVKNAGAADRYLRLNYARGGLAITTVGQTFGHPASQDAVGVAAVSAAGLDRAFNGTESVETFSSDGPRQMFFEADGTPNTAVLKKPDLAAADDVSTSTPRFSTFRGTSAAAPHAAAIAALMLEAAGGPAKVTPAELRTAMTSGTAVLDIEETGVDRDSGAGIVMAPGAVNTVAVAVADRNRAPTVTMPSALTDRTFESGADPVTIDLNNVFDDPNDDDTLTYTMQLRPADPAVTLAGSQLTLAPAGPSLTVMVTVRATDPGRLTTTRTFSVTVTARRPPPPPPPGGGGEDRRDLHGNTPAQATRVRLGSITPWASLTAGQINTADDIDYFQFSLPQAGVLVVETTGSTDTVGTIWQDGEELASADTGGERQNFRLSTRVAAGPVVVAVEGNGSRTGDYALETRLLVGYLENPGADSFQSGVGVLSGWVCEANRVEIEIGAFTPQVAAYGTERRDTAGVCDDTDNGFGLLFNWNLLEDGEHEVVALVDDVELSRATVTVTTLGVEFLRNVAGTCEVENFPRMGETVTLVWQQNTQNFVIAGGRPLVGATRGRSATVTGYLENPGVNSFQSGVGVLSGWVCTAERVEIEIGHLGRQEAGYGTERRDTLRACGDVDNGFGLLFNWNLLGDGEHPVVAWVDDIELGRATVWVTTVGHEFLRGAEGECVVEDFPMLGEMVTLEWQQNSQNFVITDVE